MKTCFSEGKLPKQFENPAFLRESLPLRDVTPLFLSNIFLTSLFFQISKTKNMYKFTSYINKSR